MTLKPRLGRMIPMPHRIKLIGMLIRIVQSDKHICSYPRLSLPKSFLHINILFEVEKVGFFNWALKHGEVFIGLLLLSEEAELAAGAGDWRAIWDGFEEDAGEFEDWGLGWQVGFVGFAPTTESI